MCDLTAKRSDFTPMAVNGRTLRRESRLNLNRMRGLFTDILFLFLFLFISYIPPSARSPPPDPSLCRSQGCSEQAFHRKKICNGERKTPRKGRKRGIQEREKRENSQSLVRPDSIRSRLVLVQMTSERSAGRSQHGHYDRYAATASDPNSSRSPGVSCVLPPPRILE